MVSVEIAWVCDSGQQIKELLFSGAGHELVSSTIINGDYVGLTESIIFGCTPLA